MTQAAQIAKPNARQAQVGELYVCPRCKGNGGSTWHVQFGICFKCDGAGVVKKADPNAIGVDVIYMVNNPVTGMNHMLNCGDSHYEVKPDITKWIGDKIMWKWGKTSEPKEVTIIAKYKKVTNAKGEVLEEKKSKGFDDIKWM